MLDKRKNKYFIILNFMMQRYNYLAKNDYLCI